jgi:transcriptional regulator with XRE-family HTH domain
MNDNKNKRKTGRYDKDTPHDSVHHFTHRLGFESDAQKEFGERLKALRKKVGVGQASLGEAIGVTENSIQNYERGQLPKSIYLGRMAEFLGCTTDYLLFGKSFDAANHVEARKKEGERRQSAQPPANRSSLADIVSQVIEILESETVYSTALEANIHAFHEAVRTEKKLQSIHDEMSERFKALEERISGLETENHLLKDKLEKEDGANRDQHTYEDTG